MLKHKRSFSSDQWERINMRNVDHLLGVEFIHNLYNRHITRINSIRFRNTVVTWKNGQVNSYAPIEEWEYLREWFGEKFLKNDRILMKEMENLLNFDRTFLDDFIKYLSKLDLKKLSNRELGTVLIDIQNYIIGELYSVNLVQIEQALTHALGKLLSKFAKNKEEVYKILSSIIVTNKLTEAQKEEIEFLKIVVWGEGNDLRDPNKNKKLKDKIDKHHDNYAFMYCAYGESPHSLGFYYSKYLLLYKTQRKNTEILIKEINDNYRNGQKLLKQINDEHISRMASLMTRVGVFRDYNKARLGQTIKFRLSVLEEISRRGLENRSNLNYYLLSEVLHLLKSGKKNNKAEIKSRKENGIILYRSEYLETGAEFEVSAQNYENKLVGMCASPGIVSGRCRVILSKKDMHKIKKGDIMVAIGTDFDLMDAIQRSIAVITEEGGLLSHAAVVCRELKKPCCIGVKDATLVLMDDMQITLDATNGLIIKNI